MANSTIISLAILKVNWDEPDGKDYLENFVPLVSECVRLSSDLVISIPDLQSNLKKRFGLIVPQNALKSILKRLKKHGYIKQENNALYPMRAQLERLNFSEIKNKVLEMEDSLVRHLISFAFDKYNLSWSQEDAEAALLGYLEENQFVVFHAIQEASKVAMPSEGRTKNRFIVGSFICSLQETNAADFNSIDIIVKGSMLANAVYLPDPNKIAKRFTKSNVYFDTSFIVYALGYGGKLRQAPCSELLEMLYEMDGKIRCFQHTVEEIYGILDACAHRLKSGSLKDAYGPSMEYFIEKGFKASDIELFKSKLYDDIKALRIEIIDKPAYEERYLIDELGLQKKLEAIIGYGNPKALQRDVDSISAIMRARRGQRCYMFEDCRALFVTTNRQLVRVSKEFLWEQISSDTLPPAITDYDLTTLLWLKRPMEAPDLPKKRIIADCYAATKPNDRLWQKYMREVDRLEREKHLTPEDVYTLRFSMEAQSMLMQLTYGDEGFFTEGTVQEILDMARSHIQREVLDQLDKEATLRRKTEDILKAKETEDELRHQQLTMKSTCWARRTSKAVEIVFMIILLLGSLYTYPTGISKSTSEVSLLRYIVFPILSISFVVSLFSLWSGRGVAWISRALEIRLARWFRRILFGLAGFERTNGD